jgi:hypothetical protein
MTLAAMGCAPDPTTGHKQIECPVCFEIVVVDQHGKVSWHGRGAKRLGGKPCAMSCTYYTKGKRSKP